MDIYGGFQKWYTKMVMIWWFGAPGHPYGNLQAREATREVVQKSVVAVEVDFRCASLRATFGFHMCCFFFPWNLPLLMLWDEIRNRTPQILEGIVFWIVFVPSNSDPRVLQILRPVGALGCSFSSRRTFSLSQDGSVCSVSSCLGFHLAMDQYSYG